AGVVPGPIVVVDLAASATSLLTCLRRNGSLGRGLRRSRGGLSCGRGVVVTIAVSVAYAIAVVARYAMVTARVATKFFDLSRRDIAVAPAFFLSLVPTRRACLVAVTVMIAFAVTVTV